MIEMKLDMKLDMKLEKKQLATYILSVCILGFCMKGIAQEIIELKEKPVTLIKEEKIYTVPQGTYESFEYINNGERLICVPSPSEELPGVTYISLDILIGTASTTVYCYPERHFVIP